MAAGAGIGDVVAAARLFHGVRSEKKRSFGKRVAREMQERDNPGEAGQLV